MSISVSSSSSSTGTTFDLSAMAEKMSKRMMSDMDTDKSGTLDKKEFVAGLTAKGVSADDAAKQFDAIDTKKTGSITQADLQSAIESGKAGPRASGSQSSGSAPAGGPPPGGGAGGAEGSKSSDSTSSKTYDAADTNKDGVVSVQEELVYKAAHPSNASTSSSSDPSKLGQVVDTTA